MAPVAVRMTSSAPGSASHSPLLPSKSSIQLSQPSQPSRNFSLSKDSSLGLTAPATSQSSSSSLPRTPAVRYTIDDAPQYRTTPQPAVVRSPNANHAGGGMVSSRSAANLASSSKLTLSPSPSLNPPLTPLTTITPSPASPTSSAASPPPTVAGPTGRNFFGWARTEAKRSMIEVLNETPEPRPAEGRVGLQHSATIGAKRSPPLQPTPGSGANASVAPSPDVNTFPSTSTRRTMIRSVSSPLIFAPLERQEGVEARRPSNERDS